MPSRAVSFFAYGNTKNFLLNWFGLPKDSAESSIISGIVAGFAVVTATNPIWVVKTRYQIDLESKSVVRKLI